MLQNEQLVLDLHGEGERLRVLMTLGQGLGYAADGLDPLAGSAEIADGQAVLGPHSWAVLG